MSIPTLSFDAGAAKPPIPFTVHGIRSDNGEPWSETFHAAGDMAAGQVIEFEKMAGDLQKLKAQASGLVAGSSGSPVTEASIMPFFEQALVWGDAERFRALIADYKVRPVGLALVFSIMEALIEAVTDRPTPPSSNSSSGRGTTPATSDPASSSPPVLPPAASPTSTPATSLT